MQQALAARDKFVLMLRVSRLVEPEFWPDSVVNTVRAELRSAAREVSRHIECRDYWQEARAFL